MPTLKIDGQDYEFEPGMSVIQVCEMHGIEIPRFCYHEKLEIAGNCRMCLVEVKPGPPKPQASCALPAAQGQEIFTKSATVKKAREGVMEFLLINHPLDCPICDQGGECDLQDQAMFYGTGISRYGEMKRAVEDKYMGPLIKTEMTRCIHCTRCVRFAEDIAGVPTLGALHRGEHMEITTYLEQALDSELSGNVIDLCPVGALTSKPYAFLARPWELTKTESIDVLDAVGSNVRIDSRGQAVLRILPRLNEEVNEEWLADKSRYACDGLRNQRLDKPYIRKDGKLREASWEEAFDVIYRRMRDLTGDKMAAIAGNLCDAESMMALKDLMEAMNCSNIDCRQDGAKLDPKDRASYLFNTTIAGLEEADACLLIGTNPRHEAPLINARLRKAYLHGGTAFYSIGQPVDLTYPIEQLGNDPQLLNAIASGKHPIAQTLKDAEKPMLILGAAALARQDGAEVLKAAKVIAEQTGMISEGWNGFNFLHYAAARVGGLDLGFVPGAGGRDMEAIITGIEEGEVEFVYLLGVDEVDMSYFGNAFVVYQGHHGDIGAHRADVVLPGAAYTEKDGLYVNTEGRVQEGFRAVFPPGDAREDWRILRALSDVMGRTLPYDSQEALRQRMRSAAPHFVHLEEITPSSWNAAPKLPASGFKIDKAPFEPTILNYYMTDPISRASSTMAECTKAFSNGRNGSGAKEAA